MNFSASSSEATFFHSARSGGVRKYASGVLSQSLYLESSASIEAAIAKPARAKKTFFTTPPKEFVRSGEFYSGREAMSARLGGALPALRFDHGVPAPWDLGQSQSLVGARAAAFELLPKHPEHLLHLSVHLLHPLLHVENDLHASEIHAQMPGQRQDDLQAFDGIGIVEAGVALGARGAQQPFPLVHPKRLGMNPVTLG